jgi:hypothetical protein
MNAVPGISLVSLLLVWCTSCRNDEKPRENGEKAESAVSKIESKLAGIEVGPIDLNEATIEEAIEFLRIRAREQESGPAELKGIGFVVRTPRVIKDAGVDDEALALGLGGNEDPNAVTITLKMGKVPLTKALDLICDRAGLRWFVDHESLKVVIVTKADGSM